MTGKGLEGSGRMTEGEKTAEVSLSSPFFSLGFVLLTLNFWKCHKISSCCGERRRWKGQNRDQRRLGCFWLKCVMTATTWTQKFIRLQLFNTNIAPLFEKFFFGLFPVLQPEELEALHSHTFRVKTFKKTKHCSVCKQIIIQDGLICRGQCSVLKLPRVNSRKQVLWCQTTKGGFLLPVSGVLRQLCAKSAESLV